MKRVLIVCHDINSYKKVLQKGITIAQEMSVGATVLFIHETELFNFFSKEESFEKSRVIKQIKEYLRELDAEDSALLVEEGASVDWVTQELTREKSTLLVVDYLASLTVDILKHVSVNTLIVKEYTKNYTQALITTECTQPINCLQVTKNFAKSISLYMDSSLVSVPIVPTPMIDITGDMINSELYEEMLADHKEQFQNFCEKEGLECSFGSYDDVLSQNIVAATKEQGADLLVVTPLDTTSTLFNAMSDILEKVTTDTLLCFE